MPRLSVLLSYYNLASYLDEAITSIRVQTYPDFELLLLDDGSTDRSNDIAKKHAEADPRIKIIRSEKNLGIPTTLNRGINAARSDWVALMDGDDVSLPARLETQIRYLDSHPDVVAVGCFPLMIDTWGGPIGTLDIYHENHSDIESELLGGHGWAFLQPTVIMLRAAALQIGGYNESLSTSMDLDFFLRLGEVGRLANVPAILHHYRMRKASVTHERNRARTMRHNEVLAAAYARRGLAEPVPIEEPQLHGAAPTDLHIKWAWWALGNRHLRTARRQSLLAILRRPLSLDCWRLLYCCLRGR